MKLENKDVLVVGGGLAACAAAKAVADAGKKAAMVFPNGGASELSSGCLDVFGVVPGETPEVVSCYADGIEKAAADPKHPLSAAKDSVQKGIDALVGLAAEGGYSLKGFDGRNVWIPNLMGTFTIAAYVPATLENAVFEKGAANSVLVVGFNGNVAFNAVAAAMSYKKYQRQLGFKNQYYSLNLTLKGLEGRHKLSDSEVADYLDTPEGVADLADKLKEFMAYNAQSYDLILLPPVLGFINYKKALDTLEAETGVKVAEVLTGCNAVVGYRMTRAIYKGLEKAGVTLLKGSTVDKLSICEKVALDCTIGIHDQLHTGEKVTLEAPAVVLATGGLLGGGVQARRREVWLNLLEVNLGQVDMAQLNRNPVYGGGQGVLTWGASVNADMAVTDDKYQGKVFACGDFVAGFNSASERSGAGVAAGTGYLAGTNAAAKA